VPREPLRQEKVPASPVDIGHRRMPERVEGIEPIESRLHLPCPEGELNAALADADARLGAEEGIAGLQSLPTSRLVAPKFPELTHQRIRQENVARSPTLGDFGPDSEASPRGPIIYIDISHVQPYNLGQSEAGSQSKRVNQVVPGISGRGVKNRLLFAVGQGRWGKVRHRDLRGAMA